MEALHRLSSSRLRLIPISLFHYSPLSSSSAKRFSSIPILPTIRQTPIFPAKCFSSSARERARARARAGWFVGLSGTKKTILPKIVKAGNPVLRERAHEVDESEIKSEKVQKIIDDMIRVMRKAPGVGVAAPQIGIPLRIVVLEDREEYMRYETEEEIKAQDRRPFDLLVIVNPKLLNKSNKTALFFEGCLSVDGFSAVVERYLDVEVSGFDRHGEPIKINASGWQARILQHECDHLDGTLYVDKMLTRTLTALENVDLPLPHDCPKLGPR